MKTIPPESANEVEEPEFKPLTALEAEQWRRAHPQLSVWRVVMIQCVVGVLVSLAAWWVSGRASVAWSALYGAVVVVVPSALFARGLLRQAPGAQAGAAMLGFFGWEIAKIVLSVALLAAAPRLVPGLHWLVLVVSMVITMKTYWIALLVQSRVRKTD